MATLGVPGRTIVAVTTLEKGAQVDRLFRLFVNGHLCRYSDESCSCSRERRAATRPQDTHSSATPRARFKSYAVAHCPLKQRARLDPLQKALK
jgi:hypothetical protein